MPFFDKAEYINDNWSRADAVNLCSRAARGRSGAFPEDEELSADALANVAGKCGDDSLGEYSSEAPSSSDGSSWTSKEASD